MSTGAWQVLILLAIGIVPALTSISVARNNDKTLDRLPFLYRLIWYVVLFLAINFLAELLTFQTTYGPQIIFGLVAIGSNIILMYLLVQAICFRLRSAGISIWWGLLFLLPIINLLLLLFCVFKAGDPKFIDTSSNTEIRTQATFATRILVLMGAAAYFGYFLLGVFQIAAIMAGVEYWLGWHWVFSAFIGLFLAYIPVIGTVAGVTGAIYGWGWPVLQAVVLFFGPLAFIFIIGIMADRSR
ncbi:hypothetical protein NBZ79_00560 [Sneathiella marina]|uniref:DUF805 domain-containing protein n=1 Tax=Sneathiella marina TaxID=2950108 RepID=A0ABY4W9Z3_9PROT|nr:hypothetical protein [Sneathiella marina]USG61466.1 hypothetical protein NBZ79_00560 [Sneathiella marina]